MTRTIRCWHEDHDFDPNWYRHESKLIRRWLHRASRHFNKTQIMKGWDVEVERKTCGWMTW